MAPYAIQKFNTHFRYPATGDHYIPSSNDQKLKRAFALIADDSPCDKKRQKFLGEFIKKLLKIVSFTIVQITQNAKEK